MTTILWSKPARRALRRMRRPQAGRVLWWLAAYAADPAGQRSQLSLLEGSARLLRLRVGPWRVVFADRDDTLIVTAVLPHPPEPAR